MVADKCTLFCLLTLFILLIVYLCIKPRDNGLIGKYKSDINRLQNQLNRLGGTLPTNISQCVLINDPNPSKFINDYIISLQTNLQDVMNSYSGLKNSPAYSTLSNTEKTTMESQYITVTTNAQDSITKSTNININNRIIYNWKGSYPCNEICTANNTGSVGDAIYSFQKSDSCTCPLNYFPQNINGFIKCSEIDCVNLTNEFPSILLSPKCLQQIWLSLGCTTNGTAYPSDNYAGWWINGAGTVGVTKNDIIAIKNANDGRCRPIVIAPYSTDLIVSANNVKDSNDSILWYLKTPTNNLTNQTLNFQIPGLPITTTGAWSGVSVRASNLPTYLVPGTIINTKGYTFNVKFSTLVSISSLNIKFANTALFGTSTTYPARIILDTQDPIFTVSANAIDKTFYTSANGIYTTNNTNLDLTIRDKVINTKDLYITIFEGIINNSPTSVVFRDFKLA